MRKIKKIQSKDLLAIFKLITAFIISKLYKVLKKNKDIWLISERENDAQDNGFFLFKYIRETYPNKQVFYAINYNSNSFVKVKSLGKHINFGSFKHYIYYFLASKNISSQIGSGEPAGQLALNLEILGIIKNKKVFLQHGVIKDILEFALYKNTKIDLFVCGAKPEFDFVKANFGYPENNVKYLGLCRFDNLHDFQVKKNQILLMPTWRQWIDNDGIEFIETDYFHTYNSLLNNKKLISYLKENNLELVFFPHNNVKKYINNFNIQSNDIKIFNETFDLQEILKTSAFLITDFSSVFFDFAYMKKPTIFYQFDTKKYRENHYAEGYFNYERDAFGPVYRTEEEIVNSIIYYHEKEFQMNKNDLIKVEAFFELHDQKNTERTYEEISKL